MNLNTWLVQNGYMVVRGPERRRRTLADLFGRGKFWEGVDWSRTRAYAVGLGQIYFNLRGREAQGIVSAGAEYQALQDEIRAKLADARGPRHGRRRSSAPSTSATTSTRASTSRTRPTCRSASTTATAWAGRTRWAAIQPRAWSRTTTASGAATTAPPPPRSAAACSSATARSRATSPHIMDLAPTILKLLEVPVPADLDGKPLL